jgi:hypothetical protein
MLLQKKEANSKLGAQSIRDVKNCDAKGKIGRLQTQGGMLKSWAREI